VEEKDIDFARPPPRPRGAGDADALLFLWDDIPRAVEATPASRDDKRDSDASSASSLSSSMEDCDRRGRFELALVSIVSFAAALRHVGAAGLQGEEGRKIVDLEIQRLTPRGFVRRVLAIVSREEFQFLDARSSDVCPSSVIRTDSIIVPQRASVLKANGLSFRSVRADFSSV
jgi:hypothetical protein